MNSTSRSPSSCRPELDRRLLQASGAELPSGAAAELQGRQRQRPGRRQPQRRRLLSGTSWLAAMATGTHGDGRRDRRPKGYVIPISATSRLIQALGAAVGRPDAVCVPSPCYPRRSSRALAELGLREPPYVIRRPDGQVVQLSRLLYLVASHAQPGRELAEIGTRRGLSISGSPRRSAPCREEAPPAGHRGGTARRRRHSSSASSRCSAFATASASSTHRVVDRIALFFLSPLSCRQ